MARVVDKIKEKASRMGFFVADKKPLF